MDSKYDDLSLAGIEPPAPPIRRRGTIDEGKYQNILQENDLSLKYLSKVNKRNLIDNSKALQIIY